MNGGLFMRRGVFFKVGIAVLLVGVFSGCMVDKIDHGYCEKSFDIDRIKAGKGKLSKAEIVARVGEPTLLFSYDPNTWYYLYQQTVRGSVSLPEVVKHEGYVLSFSPQGILCAVKKADPFLPLIPEKEETPAPSQHREEFLKQLFRNLGRATPGLSPAL